MWHSRNAFWNPLDFLVGNWWYIHGRDLVLFASQGRFYWPEERQASSDNIFFLDTQQKRENITRGGLARFLRVAATSNCPIFPWSGTRASFTAAAKPWSQTGPRTLRLSGTPLVPCTLLMRATSFFSAPIFRSNASQLYHRTWIVLETSFSPPWHRGGCFQSPPLALFLPARSLPVTLSSIRRRRKNVFSFPFSRVSRQLLRFPRRSRRCWWSRTVVLMMQLAVMWCGPEGSMPPFPFIFFTSWHFPVFAQSLLHNGRKMKDVSLFTNAWAVLRVSEADYYRGFFCFSFFSEQKQLSYIFTKPSGKLKGGGSLIAILISGPFTHLLVLSVNESGIH